jgi:hypothetical protein
VVFPFAAKAPVVACVNGYDPARDHLNKFIAAAAPKDGEAVTKMLGDELDRLFKGRKLTAVRKDARIFFVLHDLAPLFQGDMPAAVLVPVTSHKAFLESFLTREEFRSLDRRGDGLDVIRTTAFGEDQPAYLVDLKDYTAISLDKPTADAYAGRYTPATAAQMGNEPAETFLKADFALYVNLDAINDHFGEQIRGFKGLVDFAFQQAEQQGALQALNRKQIEAAKVMLKGLIQGIEDCRSVVAAAEFRPEGLYVRVQAQFAENTPSTRFLAGEKPRPLGEVNKLPRGFGTYSGMRLGDSVAGLIRDAGQEFATTPDDARGADLIERHLKDLAAAGPGGEFSATLPPKSSLTVTEYKDADKAARALSKAFKCVGPGGRVGGIVVKTTPRVGDEAESHRGFTFSSVNLHYDFEASAAGLPEFAREAAIESYRRMVPQRSAQWIGTNGKVVVRLAAKDWEAAAKILDQYLDGKSPADADEGYRRVRERLPAEANLLVIADVEQALNGLVSSLRVASEALPGFPHLRPLKKPAGAKAAYAGFAVILKGDTATAAGFLPAASAGAAYKMLDSLLKKID